MSFPMVALGEVLTERKEAPSAIDLETGKIRIVAKVGFNDGEIRVREDGQTKTGMILIRPGDLVVSGINAAKGAIAVYKEENTNPIAATIHYGAYIPKKERVDIMFLWWLLRSRTFRDILLEYVPGGIKTELKAKRLLPIPIPLPSLDEQRRIVARIEKMAAKIEEARGLRKKAEEEAKALWESSLITTFIEFSKVCPNKIFRDFCDVVRGGSPRPAGSPIYYEGHIPFLKVADLTRYDNKYVTEFTTTIKQAGLSRSRYVEPDTLMLTNSGATLGVPKITTFGTCFNDGVQAFLNIPDDIFNEYLYYFFRSKTKWFREWAARGQGQPNLNTEMVKEMQVPYPPLPEQRRIVAYLDELQAKVDALRRLQAETGAELDALMPAVLDRAFKGEL